MKFYNIESYCSQGAAICIDRLAEGRKKSNYNNNKNWKQTKHRQVGPDMNCKLENLQVWHWCTEEGRQLHTVWYCAYSTIANTVNIGLCDMSEAAHMVRWLIAHISWAYISQWVVLLLSFTVCDFPAKCCCIIASFSLHVPRRDRHKSFFACPGSSLFRTLCGIQYYLNPDLFECIPYQACSAHGLFYTV